jgi:hypothetical protein
VRSPLLAVIVIVAVAACTRSNARPPVRERPVTTATDRVSVRLIDSVAVPDWPEIFLQRVEVASENVDTIPGLLTTELPTIVGDSMVLGLAVGITGQPEAMFRYRIHSHRLERLLLPGELSLGLSGVSISPNGRWQSYVAIDTTAGWAQAVIQRFPNGPILRRAPLLPLNTMGGRMAEAEWRDTTNTVLYLDGFRDAANHWYRIRGDMYSGKWRVDTIIAGQAQ